MIDLAKLPPEVREVLDAAQGVHIGRYHTGDAKTRGKQWQRLGRALEVIGMADDKCPLCGQPVLHRARRLREALNRQGNSDSCEEGKHGE